MKSDTQVDIYQKKKLLILDDDALTGQTIRSIAEFAGLEVRFTTESRQFFLWARDWQPTFIAIDLIMPEMDGVEVMQALAKQQSQANLIITSGVGSRVLDAAVRSAREHGLNILGSLAKPFSPAELRALLSQGSAAKLTRAETPAFQGSLSPQSSPSPQELRHGIDHDELRLLYQPKIHCQTGTLQGLEALVRWQHPRLGLLTPDRFIPMAESQGLIDDLTEWVVTHALAWMANIRTKGWPGANQSPPLTLPTNITLSINISARSLSNFQLFDRIASLCHANALKPERVIFELTETSAMEDPISSLDILTRLRVQGFQLSIDDFGTGFSSMLQLVRLPFSEMKIDKSFVMTANDSAESRAVIKSIVDLGHSLGIACTAEGIEDEDALNYLKELGCEHGQGFYISRPVDSEALQSWFQDFYQTNERRRLTSLHHLKLLDTPYEERFDRIARLAQRLFEVPIALVSLIDEHRQWFKSHPGLSTRQTPRSESFCTYTIKGDRVMIIEDATLDERVSHLAAVSGPDHVRFYAGYPLKAADGSQIGTLCIIDTRSRTFNSEEIELLNDLGGMVEQELVQDQQLNVDALTRTLTRTGFERRAEATLKLCRKVQLGCTLLLFSLDNLAQITHQAGQDSGDNALIGFGRVLARCCRESDLIGRYSDDYFIVLLTNHLPSGDDSVLKRIETLLVQCNQPTETSPQLLIRYGLANTDDLGQYDLQSLIVEADKRLVPVDAPSGQ
ncbi:MAG: EAL domain-containing protein [Saccharospirillum sp.]|nr:EAL domain-containing protein [Saccharospirillum sp.]